MNKIIEVFRAGKQKDSKGKTKTWTSKDLDTMVSKYNDGDSGHEAPIVIGHPKTDDPAFGWVKKLSRKGNTLFAELGDVVEEFQEAFNKGLYKKRSISLYPDLTLKHVGFLGAKPPAVKGLADFKFSESDETMEFELAPDSETMDFADYETAWGFRDIGRTFRSFREYLIGKGEKEAADEIVPNFRVKGLEDFKETDSQKAELNNNFEESNQNNGVEKMTELEKAQAKIKTLEKEAESFAEQKEELETKLTAETKRADEAVKEFSDYKDEQEKEEISLFCENLVKEGKLAAGDKDLTETSLLALKTSEKKFEFGEGDDKKEVSAFEAMKTKLSNAKSKVEFGEFAQKDEAHEESIQTDSKFSEFGGVDQERSKLHAKAKKIQKEKGIEFSEALEEAEASN